MKIIPRTDLMSAEPVLPIRWCLENAESRQLKAERAKNIHILFVIAYEGDSEDRMLVPIDQMMAYLNIRRPGTHKVFATVLWGDNLAAIQCAALKRADRHKYEHPILNWERTRVEASYKFRDDGIRMLRATNDDGRYPNTAELEVVVPAEHFPKEPPKWIARVVNFQFELPPWDQCAFRNRCLVAPIRLLWFAFVAVLTTIIRIIVALPLALHGLRNIGFEAILHPWRDGIGDVWSGVDRRNSWFLYDAEGQRWSRWRFLLYPYIYLAFFIVVTIVKVHNHLTYLVALDWTVWGLVLASLAVYHWFIRHWFGLLRNFAVIAALLLLLRGIKLWDKKSKQKKLVPVSPKLLRQRASEEAAEYDELARLLACQSLPFEVDLGALPPARRTLKLRFFDLKRRVCRPYAAR